MGQHPSMPARPSLPQITALISSLALLSLPLSAFASALHEPAYGTTADAGSIPDLAPSGENLAVLLFIASDCPVSNRYLPVIAQIRQQFALQPIHFWLVYPNAYETAAGVARHQAAYGVSGIPLLPSSPALLGLAHARVTPEAAVLVRDRSRGWMTIYHGRIDDRYASFGQQRPAPTSHDLADAITAALHHRPVSQAFAPPVGCAIVPATPQL